jgi:hypothetical protein
MTDAPPQAGLIREDTGHPHPLFPGWYITDSEMRNIQRRADRRGDHVTDDDIRRMKVKPLKTKPRALSITRKKTGA